MRIPISLVFLILFATPAVADHDAFHRCNYASPGYETNRFIDNKDGTVTDTRTRLQWQRCSLGEEWNDDMQQCLGYVQRDTWKNTLENTVLFNQEQAALGKASNWRLPNIKELASIVSTHCVYPAIDHEAFPYSTSTYWTSTPYTTGTIDSLVEGVTIQEYGAWAININLSGKEHTQGISQISAGRLVRTP